MFDLKSEYVICIWKESTSVFSVLEILKQSTFIRLLLLFFIKKMQRQKKADVHLDKGRECNKEVCFGKT
jgi:hypothetical protein